jgi:hypothetical protein
LAVEEVAEVERAPARRRRVIALALQRPYLAVFVVGLSTRAVGAVLIWVFRNGSIYDDDRLYTTMAFQSAHGQTGTWDAYTHWLWDHTSTMLIPLSLLYRVLRTSSTLPGQLTIACVGAGVAVLVARLYRPVGGAEGALAVGLVVALLPSQVVLSSVALKDAPVWATLVGISILVARGPASRGRWDGIVPLATAMLLFLLAHLRSHTFVTAALALAVATVVLARRRQVRRTIGMLAVAVFLPWLLGFGPVGISFVTDHAGSIEAIRGSNATGNTAIAAATTTTTLTPTVTVGPPPTGPATTTTTTRSANPSYDDAGSGGTDVKYLPRGVFALLMEPLPWRSGDLTLRLAAAETVIWYPMLLLAIVGLLCARRQLDDLAFPIVVGVGTLVMWGLIEGNVGTAYRHRGEFAWVICVLAVLGAQHLLARRAVRAAER